jgi:hypothetical protein
VKLIEQSSAYGNVRFFKPWVNEGDLIIERRYTYAADLLQNARISYALFDFL